jgi:hypothetical protein
MDKPSPQPTGTTVTYTAHPVNSGSPYEWRDALGNVIAGQTGVTMVQTYNTAATYQPSVKATKSGGGYTSSGTCPQMVIQPAGDCGASNPVGTISANPLRVATGTTSTITWSVVTGVVPPGTTCEIRFNPASGGTNTSGTIATSDASCDVTPGGQWTSKPINSQTQFALYCGGTAVPGAAVVVDVVPSIIEN